MQRHKVNPLADIGNSDPAELLAVIVEAFSGVIFLFDIDTRKNLYSSDSLAHWLGYSPQQLKSLGADFILKLSHPDDLAKREERMGRLRKLKDGELDVEKERYKHADGDYHWFISRMMVFKRNDKGDPKIMVGISYDITRQEEQRLEVEKLALIAQKTTNAIIITDREKRIEWINEGYTKLTGYTLDEIKGKNPIGRLSVIENNKAAIVRIKELFEKSEPFVEELEGFSKTGEKYWLRISADPLLDNEGKLARYITIGQNITELVRNRESLMQSNNRLKHYAFFTSHQLRAPVADILSILDVFDYDNPSNPDNIRLLHDLRTVSKKLDEVVHDMNNIISADRIRYAEEKRKSRSLKSVMLVDDDRVFNNITAMILRKLNKDLEIESYTNPIEALDEMTKNRSLPDAVFLDINMPVMDGWKFLEHLDAIGKDIDVYMLTSSIDPLDMEKSKTFSRVRGYFTKPLTKKVLTEYFNFPMPM